MVRLALTAALLPAALLMAACGPAAAPPPPPTAKKEKPRPLTPAERPDVRAAYEYRCADGSTIHLTFLTDDRTAELRRAALEPPLAILKASAPGEGFIRGASRVDGTGQEISYVPAGGARQACRR